MGVEEQQATDYPPYVENEADTMWVRRDLAPDPGAVVVWLNDTLGIGLPAEAADDVTEVRMRHYAPDDPSVPGGDGYDCYHVEADGPVAYWELRS